MLTKAIVALLLLPCYFATSQSVKWPVITQVNKPWTRWWWEGSGVDKPNLTAVMQKYQQAGLGGLEITPIYGVKGYEDKFIPYLSPGWMDMLAHTLAEAKRLNLGIDMATGTGWPFGGPWITPEDACKNINLKTYTLKEGERVTDKISFIQQPMVRSASGNVIDIKSLSYPIATNKDMQALAFDQVKYERELPLHALMAYSNDGKSLNLTAKVSASGSLDWVAPAGNWTLYALFQGWHGKMVERAAPGGEGDVIDHFSLRALQNYLQHFDKAFKGRDISGIRAFFNDSYEVDDARGQSNWTPDLFSEFKTRRGYDLREHLPALFQRDDMEKNGRVLFDYRQTISDLILERFTRPWDDWAKAKGFIIRNQSHGSPANILDLYAAIDIPETEGRDILRYKFATSTANVMGKQLASAEAGTWLNEHFQSSLSDVKLAVDKFFVGGVNHIFYHGTNYSPPDDPWPGWLFYAAVHFTPANPFWKDFPKLNNYVARVQSFLQRGKPDNDILLYFPINDRYSEPLGTRNAPGRNINAYTDSAAGDTGGQRARRQANVSPGAAQSSPDQVGNLLQHFDGMEGFEHSVFMESAEYMLKEGYAFDLISDKQLLQVKSINKLLSTGGNNYQTILLSDSKYITVETMQQLLKLARDGATVIFHKNRPSQVPGYGRLKERTEELNKLIGQVNFVSAGTNGIQKAVLGKGVILTGDELPALLSFARIRKEELVNNGLMFVRRKYENGHAYFISNGGTERVESWVPISGKHAGVARFDPMFERSGLARTRKTPGGTNEIFLQLAPGESCILQTSAVVLQGKAFPHFGLAGKPEPVMGPWEIKFTTGGPELPATSQVVSLGSWTDLPGDAVKSFSGTAQYSTSIKKPRYSAQGWLLDLGSVGESAEVLLNGKKLETLIGPVYQVVIPHTLLKADNLLQINVTSGMANRIADLDRKGVNWKKFYNTNFPSRLAENRGANGLFDASKWKPKPSGLLGPVSLTPVKY